MNRISTQKTALLLWIPAMICVIGGSVYFATTYIATKRNYQEYGSASVSTSSWYTSIDSWIVIAAAGGLIALASVSLARTLIALNQKR